ncbi:MAG: S-layer homology domain-containing protein [Actinomycetota bacterium]
MNGGLIGAYPSLSDITRRGDLKYNVDFRTLYATVVSRWLDGDPEQLLGNGLGELNLFDRGPSGTGVAGFLDVDRSRYYAGALEWATENGVVNGTSPTTFSPTRPMTRAEFATVVWRRAGEPKPQRPAPFNDVPSTSFFADAVAWMVEQGITTGTSPTTFHPNRTLTRGECATFLWRWRGRPRRATVQRFDDVPSGRFYSDAVSWMNAEGITTGTTQTTFSPNDLVDRAQAITFLYRDSQRS